MLANYANDPSLFVRSITLIDNVFPGIKKVAFDGIKYHASWPEVSLPFIVEEKGKVIAHLGIIPLELILNGLNYTIAGIHGICVEPSHRKKGLFKKLMQEALQYIEEHFDSALLFTDEHKLYDPYHFKMLPEWDFVVMANRFEKKRADFTRLQLDNPEHLHIIQNLLSNHLPLSKEVNIKEKVLFILNILQKPLYYSKELNLLITYDIKDSILFIQDILSTEQYPLNEIIKRIPSSFDKVILQFCPDNFDDYEYTPIPAKPECFIMVSANFPYKGAHFRYPETYRC